MKFKEIIKESPTDVVARFYKEASADSDRLFNSENVKYKEKNNEYYEKHFKQWFSEEIVPVFTKPVSRPQPVYNNVPDNHKLQSPGYRGLQYALHHAGLPYNHNVQKYEPNTPAVVSTYMNGAQNSNGN